MAWRIIQILFALAVAASAVDLIDRSGVGGDDSPISHAAASLRALGDGDVPGEWSDEVAARLEPFRSIASSFDEVARALDG